MPTVSSITVCGGGNAAHVSPSPGRAGIRVVLFTPFAAEAERFRKVAAGGLEAVFRTGKWCGCTGSGDPGAPGSGTERFNTDGRAGLCARPAAAGSAPHLPAQAFGRDSGPERF